MNTTALAWSIRPASSAVYTCGKVSINEVAWSSSRSATEGVQVRAAAISPAARANPSITPQSSEGVHCDTRRNEANTKA